VAANQYFRALNALTETRGPGGDREADDQPEFPAGRLYGRASLSARIARTSSSSSSDRSSCYRAGKHTFEEAVRVAADEHAAGSAPMDVSESPVRIDRDYRRNP
jgi:hypothetical protein